MRLVSAGQVDPDDGTAVAAVSADATRLVTHIRDHGEHEERFIHPLLREAAPAIADRLDIEHEALDEMLLSLQRAAEESNAQRIYAAIVDLIMQGSRIRSRGSGKRCRTWSTSMTSSYSIG